MKHRTSTIEHRTLKASRAFFSFLLVVLVQLTGRGQQVPPPRQATDLEVSTAADVRAFLNPRQAASIGGATNGMTQPQAQASYASGTNNYTGTNAAMTGAVSGDTVSAGTSVSVASGSSVLTGLQLTLGSGSIAAATQSASSPTRQWKTITIDTGSSSGPTNSYIVLNKRIVATVMAAATGKTNIVTVDELGQFQTNDLAGFVASISGGGSSFPLTSDVSAANHAIVGISGLGMTNSSTSSDAHFTVGATGAGGYLTIALTGNTNGTQSFVWLTVDKLSASIFNTTTFTAQTAWLTNVVSPTNLLAAPIVDFSKAAESLELTTNISLTTTTNATSGADNLKKIILSASGGNRTVTVNTSWGVDTKNPYLSSFVYTLTNGTKMAFLFEQWDGVTTNVGTRFISQ